MKRNLVLVFAVLGFNMVNAQNWFASFNQGYGVGVHKNILLSSNENSSPSSEYQRNYHKTSLGRGFYTDIKIGRLLDKHSFIESGVRFHITNPLKLDNTTYRRSKDSSTIVQNVQQKITGNGFLGQLSIGFIYPVNEKSNFRAKVGVLAGKSSFAYNVDITVKNTPDSTGVTTTTIFERRWEYTSALNLGIQAGLNYNYRLNEKFGLTFELWYQLLNSRISSYSQTIDHVNGVDVSTNNNVNEVVHDGEVNTNYVITKNNELLKESVVIPTSAAGFSIGISYRF